MNPKQPPEGFVRGVPYRLRFRGHVRATRRIESGVLDGLDGFDPIRLQTDDGRVLPLYAKDYCRPGVRIQKEMLK